MNSIIKTGLIVCLTLLFGTAHANSKLAFMVEKEDGKKVIAITDQQNSKEWEILGDERWHLYPALSADSSKIAYSAGIDHSSLGIYYHDFTTGKTLEIQPADGLNLHANFSGDGKTLVYSHHNGQQSVLKLVTFSEQNEQPFAVTEIATSGSAYFPNLSSDGQFIVFQNNLSSTQKQIVQYDIKTKQSTLISATNGIHMSPALSFDDSMVVYSRKEGDVWNLYITHLLTKKTQQVTNTAHREFAPAFHPNGQLAFASDANGHFELYQLDWQQVAAIPQPLIHGPHDYYAPTFSGNFALSQVKKPELLPPARSSFGAATIGNRLYIVGGHQGPEHTYPPESFLDSLEMYDSEQQQWHQLTPRPIAAHGYDMVAYKHYLYAFGGFTYSESHEPGWKSITQVDRYDTRTDTWETVAELPEPRSSNAVVKIGDKAYVVAGWDSTPKHHGDKDGKFHRKIEIFNLTTEQFETSNLQLPNPLRRAVSAIAIEDNVVILGGISESASHFSLLDQVTALDTSTYSWSEWPTLPFATFAPAAGTIENDIYLLGGMAVLGPHQYEYTNHISVFGGQAQSWQHTGRYLSESKGFSQVVNLDSQTLGILGGHSYAGGDAPVATFETLSIQ